MTDSAATGVRPVEFGTTGFYPAFSGAANAKRSEELGFDIHGFSENHSRSPEPFGEMRDAARQTTRIRLAAGPVNFLTRHPGVIAAGIVPVQIISGGRAICGIASGDSAAAAAGMDPQPVKAMDRDLERLQAYLRGDAADLGEGRSSRLEWVQNLKFDPPPVQMACSGPRAIRLAARRAERICLGIGTNPDRVQWALDIIDEVLAETGRERDSVRIGCYAPLAITNDRTSGRSTIRTRVSAFAHMQSGKGTDFAQQPEILRNVTTKIRQSYDYSFHHPGAPAENPNSALCDEEFGDWMGVGGPPSYVVDRLGILVEKGLDFFMSALPMPEREVFASDVMPPLRALRQ